MLPARARLRRWALAGLRPARPPAWQGFSPACRQSVGRAAATDRGLASRSTQPATALHQRTRSVVQAADDGAREVRGAALAAQVAREVAPLRNRAQARALNPGEGGNGGAERGGACEQQPWRAGGSRMPEPWCTAAAAAYARQATWHGIATGCGNAASGCPSSSNKGMYQQQQAHMSAWPVRLRWRSIITPDSSSAVGLAMSLPAGGSRGDLQGWFGGCTAAQQPCSAAGGWPAPLPAETRVQLSQAAN